MSVGEPRYLPKSWSKFSEHPLPPYLRKWIAKVHPPIFFSANNNISEMRRAHATCDPRGRNPKRNYSAQKETGDSKNYLTGDLCFQVRNNLIISIIKLIPLFRGIVKTRFSRSQGRTNLDNTSQISMC